MDQIMHFCSNRTWLFMISIMVVSAGVYIAYFRQTSTVLDGVRKPPHIIFILVDDLGWNDVSFHGSAQIPTPNIDALAASGIILNNYYTSPQCTPSRASLLTGKYPFNTGLQHYVINAAEPTALPLEFTIMPQHLKRLGYATHLIGKWHLGYFKKEYTPTYRGFDTFWGFWNGVLDYYDYTNLEDVDIPGVGATWGIDLHNGTHEITDFRGKYATDVFTEKAVHIISQHDISQPLFLELNHLACHNGNRYHLMQAPPAKVAKFKHIKEYDRRTYAGVVSSLDESVGKVFQSLYEKGMLSNSIIVFSSDNGGAAAQGKSSNWPLRGTKMYMWEGSVRVSAVLWSPLLKLEESRVSMQMMHISDWLPTLYYVAGGNLEDLDDTDGKNMWEHLLNNTPSPRKEIPLNIDSIYGMSALIKGNFKLVQGSFPGKDDFWYGPSGKENSVESLDSWVWKDGSIIKYLLEKMGNWIVKKPDGWRINARINCSLYHKPNEEQACNPRKGVCLFDLSKDPCEYLNIAFDHPEVVKNMLHRIQELNSTSMKSLSKPVDPRGDPRCHNFTYVSWLDEKHLSDCPWL